MKQPKRPNHLHVIFLLLVFLCLPAVSYSLYTTDCSGNFEVKTVYDKNDTVCVSGQALSKINLYDVFPCTDAFIMDNRIWSGGETLADVMGSENRLCNYMMGGFLDEVIALPPLRVGKYDVVFDNGDAKFGAGDQVENAGAGHLFEVIDLGHPAVDSSALKGAAQGISQGYSDAIDQWNAACNLLDALGGALSLMSGDVVGAAIGVIGNITGIPTDYNGAVIAQATALIGAFDKNATPQKASGIYGNIAKHWYDLYEDPPDANFTVLATLNFSALNAELAAQSVAGSYPFQEKGTDPREAVLIKIANRSVEQAVLVKALRQSYEKYQGAVAVSNYEHAFRQIEQARQYGQWLAGNLDAMKGDLQNVKTVFGFYGTDKIYHIADMQAIKDRVTATGLSADEILSLKNVGFSDSRIDLLAQYVKAIRVPAADFSLSSSINTLTASIDTAIPAVQTFNANALATMNNLVTEFTPHHPVADAGGPYVGVTGTQISLNGGGSSDPDVGDTLNYAWDLNGDGIFGDAVGATALHTWTTPFSGLIGLQVTDSNGNSAIGYAQAVISAGNAPPVITSFAPVSTSPSASVLQPLSFTVSASDPDGDPLTYEWSVDGVFATTGTSFTLTPGSMESGTKVVLVTVRDNNPASRDTIEGRVVRIHSDVDGDGYDSSVDCNDTDPTVNPGAAEILDNGKDDDCNPATPDILCGGLPPTLFHLDADGDGFGTPTVSTYACSAPAGYVADNTDCNDADPAIRPGVTEICNGKDDNCSGQVDEGVSSTFYPDADSDSFGSPLAPLQACAAPAGYVTNNTDCLDSNAAVNPAATEITYDGIDNDCNPLTFDTVDADGDGYPSSNDCNDGDPLVNPGRREVIHNGKDDDCNPATMDNWSKSFVLGIDDASWIYYARSNGDGTFGNYRTLDYLGSGSSRGIAIEDYNGDGFLDFIAGRGNGSLYLFTNDGSDNFTNNGVVGTHPNPSGYIMDMAAGDFNNDGYPDFIANGNTNILAVFLNDGKGGTTRSTITLSNTGRGLDTADFNGDGNLDFAVSFYGTNNVWVYRGNGAGGFTGGVVGTATTSANDNYALTAADFDNDGKTDIIVGGSSNGDTYFFKGNGDGTFLAGVLVPTLDTDNYHNAMDAYDLNNDGKVDIVMGNYGSNNRLWFYSGNGDGTFGTRTAISPIGTRSSLLAVSAPPTGTKATGFPFAVINPKNQSVAVGSPASLSGLFSYDPDGSIATYAWKFGDTGSDTGATVSHPFAAEGSYLASLVVTDNDGHAAADTAIVKAFGALPAADAGGPYVLGEAQASNGRYSVVLDGSASSDDGGIASYEWDFGDGLSDNFDDGNALGWTPMAGSNWIVSGGAYEQTNASPDRTDTLIGNPKSGDYTVEADVMLVSGTGLEAQLIFRAKDTNNHYEFILRGRSGTNDVLLYRYLNGSAGQLAQITLPFTPQINTWYRMKVEAYGSNIKCYLNDSLYLNYSSDTNFAVGMVGFSTYRTDARFDNLIVSAKGTGVAPTHLYAEGSYTATLKVTDKAGQTAMATAPVTATKGTPPVADPGGPYILDETKASQNTWAVSFNGSGSTDDSGIESYAWNFGDGTTGTGANPSHTYTGVGTRTVTLTVTDRSGQSDTKTTTVTISANALPVSNPGGPYTVSEDQVVNKHWTINVDAAASTDDVKIWKYEWNFGDGTAAVTTSTASHTYANPGVYTVTLKVTDHANQNHTATTTASVVATSAPTASAGGPYTTEPNIPVPFDGSASTDNTGILSYSWDFGDGTTGKGAQPTHAYASTGSYTVTLTVKDTALQTATATTTVTVTVGNVPVANSGGPYSTNVGLPVRLNGSGSTDDFGIATYEWSIGTANFLMQESFDGTVIDSATWLFPTAGVTQNNAVTLTGSGGWGSRYLFTKNDFTLDGTGVVTGQVMQTAGGNLMFGFKDTGGNYSYTQMPYALYFDNGTLRIYESGASRAQVGSYSLNVPYHAKVELKTSPSGAIAGARYYYKPASSSDWALLYDSSYAPAYSTFKAGVSYYSGTFIIDNMSLTSGLQTLNGEKPVFTTSSAGTFPVQLTVTDGAGQSSTASTTMTVSSDPVVITAPWQYTGGIEVPHDTWSGEEVILKAVVKSGKAPLTYAWDFGDGTSSTPATVTDSYNISAKHIYSAAEGTPITARVTVTDADGKTASDTFPIIVRAKSLNVEVNKAIDDALWYVHTTQNRSNGSWQSSGWTTAYFASPTASAVHSMEINGHLEVGDFRNDPYVETVWRGMQFVLTSIKQTAITEQAYGDPDVNGNGLGIDTIEGDPIYQGGQLMMALVASGTPNMKAMVGGTGIRGRTYKAIVEDMAEMYYWGQGDDEWGYGAGGWRYGWQGQGDNSASQWAALGFEAAEEQNWIKVPQWVRDRNIVWLAFSRNGDGNGYGYTGPGNGEATTPSGLAQVAFNKIPTTDQRWKQVENFLASYWNNWYNGTGNYYSLYALAKSMRTAKPKEVTILGEGTANAIDWYNDPTRGVARNIVNQQDANGMFTGGGGTKWVEGPFRSAWGVIILTKTLFVLPPVAIAGNNMVWGIDWPLNFDGSKSYHLDPFRKIVKYEWDFDGDGIFDSSSDQPTATHTFTQLGTYKVTLRVTDNNEPPKYDTNSITVIVAIPPHPPVSDPGGPYTGYAGIPLQLDGSKSYDIDPTDIITSYDWEIDGVYPYTFTDASGAQPMVTFAAPGTYNIGLKVVDNGVLNPPNYDKLTSEARWTTVTIRPNNPPVARAGGPYTVNEGSSIALDAGGSSDPDGNPLTYAWDLDNDGTYETSGAITTFSRPDNGSFTVGLKISDGDLEATDSVVVNVVNVAPLVSPIPPATINEGGTYTGSGSFSDPGADSWTATVDYGDGSGVQPLALNPDKSFSLSHVYPQNGTYTITVTVTDDDGGSGDASTLSTVLNVAPVVNAGADGSIIEADSFISSGSFTDPGINDSWTATVDYGDGSGPQTLPLNGNSFSLNHTYPQSGSYTVTISVTDSDGGTGTDTAIVTVSPAPQADVAISKTVDKTSPSIGENVTFTVTVRNSGPATATGVLITELLPGGYTFVSATPSQGAYDAITGIWNVGVLNNGASSTLTVTATVLGAGTYINTATRTASTPADPNAANDSASSVVTPVTPATDIALTKLVDNATPTVGTNVTFTVTVSNNGPVNATGVQVTDLLPNGFSFVSASLGAYDPATGIWNVGALDNGATATLRITAIVLGTGSHVNTATRTASTPADPNAANDSASSVVTPVTPVTDIALTKLVDNAIPTVGADVTFTVTVSNSGPANATGVQVTDMLPSGYSFVGASASRGSYDSSTGVWNVGDLNNASTATLTITATVLGSGTYINTATRTASTPADPNGANDSATSVVTPQVPVTCLSTLTARAKTGIVQLNWAPAEHTPTTQYDIYRSTEGPSSGFVKIRSGYTNTYALFVNTGLTNGTTYWYRIEKSLAPAAAGYCLSPVVSGKPMALR